MFIKDPRNDIGWYIEDGPIYYDFLLVLIGPSPFLRDGTFLGNFSSTRVC